MEPKINMSTYLRHYLDAEGDLPEDLQGPARKLAEHLGQIVASVSANPQHYSTDEIKCRRTVARKKCSGTILAHLEEDDPQKGIIWFCEKCGHGGLIYGWPGTCFDHTHLRSIREAESQKQGVWIDGQRLDEVPLPLNPEFTLFKRYSIGRDIRASFSKEGCLLLTVPTILAIELFVQGLLKEIELPVSIRFGDSEARDYELVTVRYHEPQDPSVELGFVPYVPMDERPVVQ